MSVRAVLWDVGGTLVDFAQPRGQAFRRALAHCGIPPDDVSPAAIDRAHAAFAADEATWRTAEHERAGWRRHAAMVLEGHPGATPALIDELGRKFARYAAAYAPVHGIPELLADLAARHLAQGVVSNWPPSLRLFLAHHQLSRHFACIICSAEEGCLKPDVTLFRRATQQLRVAPADVIFVGNDPQLDLEPARALGMQAVHFDPRRQSPATADAHDVATLRRVLLPMLSS